MAQKPVYDIEQLFERARQATLEAPPFLAARVMAQAQSQGQKRQLWFWRSFSIASLGASLVLAFLLLKTPNLSYFEAQVDNPYVVRVELNELIDQPHLEAEIVLPEGVMFYSKNHPELAVQKSIRLVWNQESNKPFVPFVIKGAQDGKQQITVRFYDIDNNMISTRQIGIEFFARREKG